MGSATTTGPSFVALFRGDDAGSEEADRLMETGWSLPAGGHMPVRSPIPWHRPPGRASLAALHALDPIAALIGAYAGSGRAPYLERAFDVTIDWIGAHPKGLDATERVRRDLPAGRRAHRMAYVLAASEADAVGSATDRERLGAALDEHLAELAANEDLAASATWGLEQALGQISAAWQHPGRPGAPAAAAQGRQRLAGLFERRVAADGGSLEHGPGPVHELLAADAAADRRRRDHG